MEQHGTGKQKHIMDRVIELVEQRHHDVMNSNPMNTHEHKKKRRSSFAFPGQEGTIGYHGNEELVLEQTTPEPTFDVYVDDQSGRRYSVDRVTMVS